MRATTIVVTLFLLCIFIPTWANIGNAPSQESQKAPRTPRTSADSRAQTGTLGREGGETIADAYPFNSLPFHDTGDTCDNLDDYDEGCPYMGSISPDVVYAYTAAADESITIDLCASMYDTKVFVYEDVLTPGNPYACNDDFGCGYTGYQSRIENLSVLAGHTYFIVVDGYGGYCGEYDLTVDIWEPCVVDCPPGAMPEGEPPLVENYLDQYNSGCGGVPPVWQTLTGDQNGHLDLCGHSGTFMYNGSDQWDTDWFIVHASGSTITAQIWPEYGVRLARLNVDPTCYNADPLQIRVVAPCQTEVLVIDTTPGEEIWLWVGSREFSGVPEFVYLLALDGIEGAATPTQVSTWGGIKNMYR